MRVILHLKLAGKNAARRRRCANQPFRAAPQVANLPIANGLVISEVPTGMVLTVVYTIYVVG